MTDQYTRPIFPSSEKLTSKNTTHLFKKKYPWHTLAIWESFPVLHTEAKFATLRSAASKMGKKLGRKFRVVDHGFAPDGKDLGYEIGRVGEKIKPLEIGFAEASPEVAMMTGLKSNTVEPNNDNPWLKYEQEAKT